MCQGTSCPRRFPPYFRLCRFLARASPFSVKPPLSARVPPRPRAGTRAREESHSRTPPPYASVRVPASRALSWLKASVRQKWDDGLAGSGGVSLRGYGEFHFHPIPSRDIETSNLRALAEISRRRTLPDAFLLPPAGTGAEGKSRGPDVAKGETAAAAEYAHARNTPGEYRRARPLGMTVESPEFADCSTEFSCYVARSGRT